MSRKGKGVVYLWPFLASLNTAGLNNHGSFTNGSQKYFEYIHQGSCSPSTAIDSIINPPGDAQSTGDNSERREQNSSEEHLLLRGSVFLVKV